MIETIGVTVQFGKLPLFEDVSIRFTKGNCYGLIGANGTGKSTFVKVLSGELEASKGDILISDGERVAVLKQNHYEYDDYKVIDTVIMGYKRLFDIMHEKEALYSKSDFSDEDGIALAALECEFDERNGWNAESDAATLLNNLGVTDEYQGLFVKELEPDMKVKVLLAQALFGNPEILLLDEPTNHLDIAAVSWLENFLSDYENTVIVVSHDRHFLNQVCTHIADIDFRKIKLYVGNYDFWYESSQLALKQAKDANKKTEAKMKEMQEFITRFSANASKSKQATSRKKLLEKLVLDEIKPSSRRYPFIDFKPSRELGNNCLSVTNLTKKAVGETLLDDISFIVNPGDKIAFIGLEALAKTTLFGILAEEIEADSGDIKWGVTTSLSCFPKDNTAFFDTVQINLVDWLRQFSEEKSESFIRGFFGRMLFSGDETQKKACVLSGGEKVRCMLSKMMLEASNVLILDEPTNHLDLESITSLNNAMISTKCTLMFSSHDHQFIETSANRIIEISGGKIIYDKYCDYDSYLQEKEEKEQKEQKEQKA